jgi:hypothetical protein
MRILSIPSQRGRFRKLGTAVRFILIVLAICGLVRTLTNPLPPEEDPGKNSALSLTKKVRILGP